MKKTIYYIVLIVIFLVLWKCQVFKEPAAAIMSTTLDTPKIEQEEDVNLPDADFNLIVSDLDGNTINMVDYKGKVIFLNFWATWCMPCVAELPSIENLYSQFKDDVAFLLISNESIEKVKNYHTKKEYTVPFHIRNNDSLIPQQYNHEGIPTTFIINKNGKIVKASSGAEDWDDENFIKVLKEMI
ncbi:MAG: TlpA disulfide reductase family protein [Vicingaceae bacterium]|nr:TlpA disulfide reductase family protein [Vicingaceae bacterium]